MTVLLMSAVVAAAAANAALVFVVADVLSPRRQSQAGATLATAGNRNIPAPMRLAA
ncbi:hypothetical protein [uncultured Methylobacterium sp.]|uniref:hypothetical protein n=1 Tax=uncultured Methylobacterium sp. TaxID=157278 RepID=UPI0035C9D723